MELSTSWQHQIFQGRNNALWLFTSRQCSFIIEEEILKEKTQSLLRTKYVNHMGTYSTTMEQEKLKVKKSLNNEK